MNFSIIIATSNQRTDWLLNRSLISVYKQEGIDTTQWEVLIIDDNEVDSEFNEIKKGVGLLREKLDLREDEFTTFLMKNSRKRFMSGTGAWNTGIFRAFKRNPNGYVSILDDDDEYLPNHLFECLQVIEKDTIAVFQRLIWHHADGSTMNVDLTKESLTAENFFVGNPGVQGSNMFFRTKSLVDIDGFDETLPNTTDRDLMIRFLWKNDLNKIKVIENIGVIHYNHNKRKVNNDLAKKQKGLNLFYSKYRSYFSKEAYHKSLVRAKRFFKYQPQLEQIAICMPMRNSATTLTDAILSVLLQTDVKREIILIIGNDNSTDDSRKIAKKYAEKNPNIVLLDVNFDKVSLNRNFLNDYVRKNYPNCILIGRLDADDKLYNIHTISKIEALFDQHEFDVLLCGNKQVKGGDILEWENKPNRKLLENDFLQNQLYEMTKGIPEAELPSCNTFIKPSIDINYPLRISAEDHWFTVMLLLQKENLNIIIDEDLIYCYYSLDGFTTADNISSNRYHKSRAELYEFFKSQI